MPHRDVDDPKKENLRKAVLINNARSYDPWLFKTLNEQKKLRIFMQKDFLSQHKEEIKEYIAHRIKVLISENPALTEPQAELKTINYINEKNREGSFPNILQAHLDSVREIDEPPLWYKETSKELSNKNTLPESIHHVFLNFILFVRNAFTCLPSESEEKLFINELYAGSDEELSDAQKEITDDSYASDESEALPSYGF